MQNGILKTKSSTVDLSGRSRTLDRELQKLSESLSKQSEMADLEIGYIAGSAPGLDGRLGAVRTKIEETIRPHRLITVSSTFVRTDLPIILDISISSVQVDLAVQAIMSGHIIRPWLVIRHSSWLGISPALAERLDVAIYRNAINVRPPVLKFLVRYPSEIRKPVTSTALSVTQVSPKPL